MQKFLLAGLVLASLTLGACASHKTTTTAAQAPREAVTASSPDTYTTLRYTDTGRPTTFWANDR